MKMLMVLLAAGCCLTFAQEPKRPLATFTGTVRQISSTHLVLARPDQDDLEIACTHNTHYYNGTKRIKRDQVKPGAHVSVETDLDLTLKPEAVNVRILPIESP